MPPAAAPVGCGCGHAPFDEDVASGLVLSRGIICKWDEKMCSVTPLEDPHRTKSKLKIPDSAVAMLSEDVFYLESVFVSALIEIHPSVEIPSQLGQGDLPIRSS